MSERDARWARFIAVAIAPKAESPAEVFDFQRALLADSLFREHSPALAKDSVRAHETKIRHVGDAVAYRLISSYALRQLFKNRSDQGTMAGSRPGIPAALGFARQLADRGRMIVIADVTNLVSIGDVIDCGNRMDIRAYEVKRKKPRRAGGRAARQLKRIQAIHSGMVKGAVQMPGDASAHHAIDLNGPAMAHPFEELWPMLDSAIEVGAANLDLRDGSRAYAWTSRDDFEESVAPHLNVLKEDDDEWFVGTSGRLLNAPSPTLPNPVAWPLPDYQRFLLLEEELTLAHAVPLRGFEAAADDHGLPLKVHGAHSYERVFSAEVEGNKIAWTAETLFDVTYCFKPISAAAAQMAAEARALTDQLVDRSTSTPDKTATGQGAPGEKPGRLRDDMVWPDKAYQEFQPLPLEPASLSAGAWRVKPRKDGMMERLFPELPDGKSP